MDWEFDELFEAIQEGYQEYKAEQMSNSEAFARTAGDFETVKNVGVFEKAIVTVALGELLLRQSKVFSVSKSHILDSVESIDNDELKKQFTSEQYAVWEGRKQNLLQKLEEKPVHHYARAFWFYDEMTEEVSKYFDEIRRIDQSADDLIFEVLQRFERDCQHSLSEKIVVLTTLAEKILQHNSFESNALHTIGQQLRAFTLRDVEEELSEEERGHLGKRIERILGDLMQ